VHLTGWLFNDPPTIQRHEKQFSNANLRGHLAEMFQTKLAQAVLQVSQTQILAIPALECILKVEDVSPFATVSDFIMTRSTGKPGAGTFCHWQPVLLDQPPAARIIPSSFQLASQTVLGLHGIELSPCSVGFVASSLQTQLQCFPLLIVLGLDALVHLHSSLDPGRLNRRQNTADHCSIHT
jgi:hypothetical protein